MKRIGICRTVRTREELVEYLAYYRAGETVNLTVKVRNDAGYEDRQISITLDTAEDVGIESGCHHMKRIGICIERYFHRTALRKKEQEYYKKSGYPTAYPWDIRMKLIVKFRYILADSNEEESVMSETAGKELAKTYDPKGIEEDPSLFMHLTEHFGDSPVAALVHRKTLPVPVAGGTHLFQLGNDPIRT